jgi:hypothetical protein
MVRVIVAIGVGVGMIVRVIVIVGVRMAKDVFVGVIVPVVMRPVFVVLEDRLHTRSNRYFRLRLRIELLAEQQHQGRPK